MILFLYKYKEIFSSSNAIFLRRADKKNHGVIVLIFVIITFQELGFGNLDFKD